MSFINFVIIALFLVFLFFLALIIIGITGSRKPKQSETTIFSGITPRIKAINFDSAISATIVAIVVILVVVIVAFAISIVKSGSAENFYNDNTFKDYRYQGNYLIDDEVLKICGNASIINKDAGYKFLGIWYFPAKNSAFGFMAGGKGTINITMKSDYEEFTFQTINIDATERVKFGASLVPGKKGKLWLEAGRENLNPSNVYFNTGGKYSVEMEVKGSVWIDELNIGG